MSSDFYWGKPYISASEKKKNNEKLVKKLAKKHKDLKPVIIEGTKIAKTFWGKAWCKNIESYQDYSNRLPRGRSYVRSGAVIDLQITTGLISALVSGNRKTPYQITIKIAPLKKSRWMTLKQKCTGKISSLLALAQGTLSDDILQAFCDPKEGLFPSPNEIETNCSCPDWADLCKHLAAVLYAIGARLDEEPNLFFVLRDIDENELVGAQVVETLTEGVTAGIATDALSDVFGMEFDTLDDILPTKELKGTPQNTQTLAQSTKKASSSQAIKIKPITPSRLRLGRKKLNLTQAQLAKLVGVSSASISKWERGDSSPKAEVHHKLAELFSMGKPAIRHEINHQ
ncbi:MAG: helix-turn-helix domain-containing protein [Akkermansia sp.]